MVDSILNILEQTSVFRPEDVIPVPGHPDALAMACALKTGGTVTPVTFYRVDLEGTVLAKLRAGTGRAPLA